MQQSNLAVGPKQVVVIWDFDGAIGQLNSSLPYNFNFRNLQREIDNVRAALDVMQKFSICSTFAVTGFTAETGLHPYTCPDLIHEIALLGHEVASHSWRHEWLPLFTRQQAKRSLARSRSTLKNVTGGEIYGFVPPHNRPMTWWRKGAFSLGDRGVYPFFPLADMGAVIGLCLEAGYRWIRISYKPMWGHIADLTGRVLRHGDMLVLENHYVGFDKRVQNHILNSPKKYHIVSAHPLMLDFPDKTEHMSNFCEFLQVLTSAGVHFTTPGSLQSEER